MLHGPIRAHIRNNDHKQDLWNFTLVSSHIYHVGNSLHSHISDLVWCFCSSQLTTTGQMAFIERLTTWCGCAFDMFPLTRTSSQICDYHILPFLPLNSAIPPFLLWLDKYFSPRLVVLLCTIFTSFTDSQMQLLFPVPLQLQLMNNLALNSGGRQ